MNGEIIIRANSIEEAEADLAMIKAMRATGAVVGCGATTIEGMRGLAEALAPMITDTEPCGVPKREEPHTPHNYTNLIDVCEAYRLGYIYPEDLGEIIDEVLRDCLDYEDKEDEGFTIESAMAYFFGGEWA